jgi:hypothetical protein
MAHLLRSAGRFFAGATLVVLAGCAGFQSTGSGPAAEAPTYRVGDRWVYRAQDGFRVPVVWDETHEVTAVGADGITVRIAQKGPTVDSVRTERWAAPGRVLVGAVFDDETRRFSPALDRYAFPLQEGQSWNQWVNNYNESTRKDGQINRYVRVRGWDKITTPAGTFDAIALRVTMRLDDEEFWRYATTCNYLVWYAPAVRGIVREEKDAEYREKSDPMDGMASIRSQHATIELVQFTAGR